MLDFSNADDQKEFARGPVPAGSIVVVQMKVLQPEFSKQAPEDSYISVSKSGLRQIYCQFDVTTGTYSGVSFRQNITLPASAQKISLNPNYEQACNIGAAQLKAICLAAQRPTRINKIQELTGARFPVRVKINNRPKESNGQVYWNNEIAFVITPDKPEYQRIRNEGEIINPNGALVGSESKGKQEQPKQSAGYDFGMGPGQNTNTDEVPF